MTVEIFPAEIVRRLCLAPMAVTSPEERDIFGAMGFSDNGKNWLLSIESLHTLLDLDPGMDRDDFGRFEKQLLGGAWFGL